MAEFMSDDQSYAERAARGARTQALYRDVNERVNEINHAFSDAIPLGEWICECANQTCSEQITLTPAEYEAVRADPRRFAIAPGDAHFFPEIEDIVEQTERYWIVEKRGEAGELATKVDPRRVGLRGKVVGLPTQQETASSSR